MEDLLRPIYQERASHANTLGIVLLEKQKPDNPATDNFDVVLFVIVNKKEPGRLLKHYQLESGKVAGLKIVDADQVDKWINLGTNRRIIDWIMNGKILFERNDYLTDLKQKLFDFPLKDRKKRIGLEFAKLIKRFKDGKELFEAGHMLDAYNYMVHALHHLARLSVIDHGFHPEVTVWNQVKKIEPEIYKLYQELLESEETLYKKLELLFLASEFLVHSSTKVGALHLLEVMDENEVWTIQELSTHDELIDYSVDFEALLEYLIDRKVIKVRTEKTKGQGIYHRIYSSF
ncbi:nucleotidyltransferase-like protein [Bacillus pinisoli]|uniref:nucleotidyltransferase-like protein n=1 Tax=Bacillus pinisoli TaxID=2901866 RepID=UPI001FF4244A|nr:nucleotidyltransferase-like protein [Bacillus pinisoli]